jgi:hypothetical protein
MADVSAVRSGIDTRLATITGLRHTAFMPDKITPPMAVVGDVEIDFDLTMQRGFDSIEVKVRVYASRASDRAGQSVLDGYLKGTGATSIKTAIEGDRTLGGAAQTLKVSRVDGYGVYTVAETQYLGAEFTVTVYVTGS